MFLHFYRSLYREPLHQHIDLGRLRIGVLAGLALAASACTSDSSFYGYQSAQTDDLPNYYVRDDSRLAHEYPSHPHPNNAKPPNWREYGQHHDTYPWLRIEPNPPVPQNRQQNQRRIER